MISFTRIEVWNASMMRVCLIISVSVCLLFLHGSEAIAEPDTCCTLTWVEMPAQGCVDFLVYSCCDPPNPSHCKVTICSNYWTKLVPYWSDANQDCNDPNTFPRGTVACTQYIAHGPFTVDNHGCPFCPCWWAPRGELTWQELMNRLNDGLPVPSTQCYTCGS